MVSIRKTIQSEDKLSAYFTKYILWYTCSVTLKYFILLLIGNTDYRRKLIFAQNTAFVNVIVCVKNNKIQENVKWIIFLNYNKVCIKMAI